MEEQLLAWGEKAVTALMGFGIGGYAIYRKLKSDSNSDHFDDRTKLLIDRLESQLERERQNAAHLGGVIDRLAKERNDAVQQVGKLQGTVHALESEVVRLREEISSLEVKNSGLTTEISGLHREVSAMSDILRKLIEQVSEGQGLA